LKESKGCNVEGICGRSNADGFAESSSGNLASKDCQAESLQHSLSAVPKSILAASRIFQTFKVESFHRQNVVEYGIMIADHLMSARFHLFLFNKNSKSGQNDMPHSAAVCIENKFRKE
jgi:hypothetical protein